MAEEVPTGNTPDPENKGKNGGAKTFTQEELDRVVSERLKREEEKAKEKIDAAAKQAREDALAEAKLSEEERIKQQREKETQAIKAREAEITFRENKVEALEELSKHEIPTDTGLVDLVIDLDKNKQKEKIKSLKTSFDAAVEKKVAEKTKGVAPKDLDKGAAKKSGVVTSF